MTALFSYGQIFQLNRMCNGYGATKLSFSRSKKSWSAPEDCSFCVAARCQERRYACSVDATEAAAHLCFHRPMGRFLFLSISSSTVCGMGAWEEASSSCALVVRTCKEKKEKVFRTNQINPKNVERYVSTFSIVATVTR
jgi:hypothetical protein